MPLGVLPPGVVVGSPDGVDEPDGSGVPVGKGDGVELFSSRDCVMETEVDVVGVRAKQTVPLQ